MCGICGKITNDREAPVEERLVRSMAETLDHRGPDDMGTLTGPGFGLGHSRLSIIDLSDRARQPLSSEDGTVHLVFNGEIYNFLELRVELEEKGHRFRSRTDAEVVLHLFEDHGPGCLDRLRGMFAFAVYDEAKHRLFAARDRIGKKPLVYSFDGKELLFGSEIKALLKDPSIKPEPDPEAIHHYLSYQYVPAPWTAFAGIKKLPAGHWLMFESGRLEVRRYWKLSFAEPLPVGGDEGEEEIAGALREKLEEAVRIRLVSDVPIGAFLSGGVDSSAVVAMMRQRMGGAVKTFSIGFEEKRYDETRHAREVAALFETDHVEMTVKPDAAAILPKLVWHYNEPFADSSGIPTFYLSELAAREVKVVLNGDGGDESFAGYDRYRAHAAADKLGFVPAPLLRLLCGCACLLLPGPEGSGKSTLSRMKRFLRQASLAPEQRNFNWFCYIGPGLKEKLYTGDFRAETRGLDEAGLMRDAYRESDAPDFLGRTLDVDIRTYLPYDLLVKVDIATMAHSLEGRSPFLDHELMEFAARIPATLKLKGMRSKHILKNALRSVLPRGILDRPKMGFGVPIDAWLRGELKEMAYDTLTGKAAASRGLFCTEEVRRLLDRHVSGRENLHLQIWALLMLELWFERFIDGRAITAKGK